MLESLLSKHEECNSLGTTAWSELNPGRQTGTKIKVVVTRRIDSAACYLYSAHVKSHTSNINQRYEPASTPTLLKKCTSISCTLLYSGLFSVRVCPYLLILTTCFIPLIVYRYHYESRFNNRLATVHCLILSV